VSDEPSARLRGTPVLSPPLPRLSAATILAIEILYATGLRRAELLALDLGDVSVEDLVVRVRRGKGRVAPFGRPAAEVLDKYLRWIRPELMHGHRDEQALLVSHSGRRLDCYTLGEIVASAVWPALRAPPTSNAE
jgi:site-specific recombinase XerD